MRAKRHLLAGAIAVVAFGLTASEASAGDPFTVSVAKKREGPYAPTVTGAQMKPGKVKNFFFRVESTGDTHALLFDDYTTDGNPTGYRVRWFHQGENVNSEVKGSGFAFTVKFGTPETFRARVKALKDRRACISGQADFEAGPPEPDEALVTVNDAICVV